LPCRALPSQMNSASLTSSVASSFFALSCDWRSRSVRGWTVARTEESNFRYLCESLDPFASSFGWSLVCNMTCTYLCQIKENQKKIKRSELADPPSSKQSNKKWRLPSLKG
jgi:hypothetical protein